MEPPCHHPVVPVSVCPTCPRDRPEPCLVLAWHAFLTELEDLAERETRAVGERYQRIASGRLLQTVIEAEASGLRPRGRG